MCDHTCSADCKPFTYEQVEKIADFLKSRVDIRPRVGVFCGTGLGAITTLLTNPISIPYSSIPNFPVSTVPGHEGKLVFGYIGPLPVVCMKGRFHLFEGYPLWKCVLPVRVMKLLGISLLVLSNAAGGINPSYGVGDIMLFKDHINFVNFGGSNPLQGPNEDKFGPRFVAINDAYDKNLLKVAKDVAKEIKLSRIREGVYACLGGPCFETVAELKMLKMIGADAVGMSTVHEVIAARHCGLKCLAFSLITNKCPMDYNRQEKPDHEEILNVGREQESLITNYVEKLFQRLAQLQL